MGEEPAHFLNMMDGNFITLQVGIVVTHIIVAIVAIVVVVTIIVVTTTAASEPCRFSGSRWKRCPLAQQQNDVSERVHMDGNSVTTPDQMHALQHCNGSVATLARMHAL